MTKMNMMIIMKMMIKKQTFSHSCNLFVLGKKSVAHLYLLGGQEKCLLFWA